MPALKGTLQERRKAYKALLRARKNLTEGKETTASGTVGLTARHTGSGWYEVEGEEGKVRKKDLPEGAIITE